MNEALTALYALQQVDSALAAATKKLMALDSGKAEQAAAESSRANYEAVTHKYHSSSGSLKDAELELQGEEKKSKDFETKLYGGKVQNPKELQAIQEEIEALGRQRGRIPNYAARQAAGKTIGSGSGEKGVDMVVNRRLKGRRGMRWWRRHADAVVALRLATLNREWEQCLAGAFAA